MVLKKNIVNNSFFREIIRKKSLNSMFPLTLSLSGISKLLKIQNTQIKIGLLLSDDKKLQRINELELVWVVYAYMYKERI